MAFEIFNALTAWPDRIEALVGVVAAWEGGHEEDLAGLLSPGASAERRGILADCLDTSVKLGLLRKMKGNWQLTKSAADAVTSRRLRQLLQKKLLVARSPSDDHHDFCLFFAWMIACTGRRGYAHLLSEDPSSVAGEFTARILADRKADRINAEKARAGFRWAEWLGLGLTYQITSGAAQRFAAFPRQLLLDACEGLMAPGESVPARQFAEALKDGFPLLDGGDLAARLPPAFRPASDLGPALSEALRLLQDDGMIELVEAADAPAVLRLHRDDTRSGGSSITEIRRRA